MMIDDKFNASCRICKATRQKLTQRRFRLILRDLVFGIHLHICKDCDKKYLKLPKKRGTPIYNAEPIGVENE